jgi:transposase-like protein|tara:strand:+ start:69 stop:1319 length:1251 start_codon:yes stop_codon:yes gene_type:complete
MRQDKAKDVQSSRVTYETLEGFVREKAQGFIQDILEEEVSLFLGREKSERFPGRVDTPKGYRNGYGKPRKLSLMNGTVKIRRPRVRGTEENFESKVLPFFKRKSKEVGELLPELYLHGLSKGDFELALRNLLGDGAPLSPSSIQRLKGKWQMEYEEWKKRDLSALEVVYLWADGIYVKAGLEKDKAALLVVIGSLSNGNKVVLACESGYRESKESWSEVLRNLKSQGLRYPRLTIADGHLGMWAALRDIYPESDEQRCWNHKIMNVLDALPKRVRPQAKELLSKIPYAPTKGKCEKLRDQFTKRFEKDYGGATKKLLNDWERMVTFYSFPKEHWVHLRTTNIVESPFNAIRLRTNVVRRYKKVESATAMIWKLMQVAQKNFRILKGAWLLPDVYSGKTFIDGIHIKNNLKIERKAA